MNIRIINYKFFILPKYAGASIISDIAIKFIDFDEYQILHRLAICFWSYDFKWILLEQNFNFNFNYYNLLHRGYKYITPALKKH